MDAWDEYTEKVMDHYEHPRNVGIVENPSGIGVVGNPACGDVMKLSIEVKDDVIVDARFKTFGCGAAIATSSMVTEMIKGKRLDEALKVSNKAVAESLGGLPQANMHRSPLGQDALKAAIDDYTKRQKQETKK